jgi:hypothetical protein
MFLNSVTLKMINLFQGTNYYCFVNRNVLMHWLIVEEKLLSNIREWRWVIITILKELRRRLKMDIFTLEMVCFEC